MKYIICLFFLLLTHTTWANNYPHPYVAEAQDHYKNGDYDIATHYLLAVPGLAHLSPKLTALNQEVRARLFFDLGCTYLAAGDSTQADQAFKTAFLLNDELKHGYIEESNPGTFWWALKRNQESNRRLKTKRLFAAMRSLTIPGWGQFYRGHKKKGYAFLGAAIITSGLMSMEYFKYRNAKKHYNAIDPTLGVFTGDRNAEDGNVGFDQTNNTGPGAYQLLEHYRNNQRYLNSDGTQYTEWESRFRQVRSGAKRMNIMLGVLGIVWALGTADSAIFGPAPMSINVSF